jgi:hypothetical protein
MMSSGSLALWGKCISLSCGGSFLRLSSVKSRNQRIHVVVPACLLHSAGIATPLEGYKYTDNRASDLQCAAHVSEKAENIVILYIVQILYINVT